MHYLILTKLEYPTAVSLKVKGLRKDENEKLVEILNQKEIRNASFEDYLEADLSGVEMLNVLGNKLLFGYRVVGQAMAMEHSDLGGRSFQIEKVIWTLENDK